MSENRQPASTAVRRVPSGFAQYKALLGKDLRREFRTKEMLTSMGLYAVLVLLVYGIAVAHAQAGFDVTQIAGGLLWALIVFTSLLGLARSFAYEKQNSCIDGLLLAPLDRSVVFLAKASANFLFLVVVEIITVALFALFFLSGSQIAPPFGLIAAPLLLGTIGVAGLGTLLSTITMHTSGKDVMLALLFIPLMFPLLYACVSATSAAIIGADGFMDVFQMGLGLAAGYDVIMIALSWFLYDFVISA